MSDETRTRLTERFEVRPRRFGRADEYEIAEGAIDGPKVVVGAGTLADVRELGEALVRFADGKGAGLTVGAALARPEVQDGSHIVEYRRPSGAWCQAADDNFHGEEAHLAGRWFVANVLPGWSGWSERFNMADLALPCVLVPLASADDPPGARSGRGG